LKQISEFERFEDYTKTYNKNQSFADQSLNHEIAINSGLIAIEHQLKTVPEITDFFWLRTSPRHDLTSTKIVWQGKKRKQTRTINPDALLVFRAKEIGWFFFMIEVENNIADPYKYRDAKLLAYWQYYEQGNNPTKRQKGTRYFCDVAHDLNNTFNLGLSKPDKAQFRVLTIATEERQARRLFAASTAIPTERLFYFTDLNSLVSDPFGLIWMRKKEFSNTPYTEIMEGKPNAYPSLLAKYNELIETNARPTIQRRWLDTTIADQLPKVAIP